MTIDEAFARIPILSTERLVLREMRSSDAEAFFAAYSDTEVMRYQGSEPLQTLAEAQTAIQTIREKYEAHQAIRWGITLKGDDAWIGSCGFHHFDAGYSRAETRGPREPPPAVFRLVNPLMKLLLRSPLHGLVSKRLMLLTMTGRKSGKQYSIPVGYTQVAETLYFGTNGK